MIFLFLEYFNLVGPIRSDIRRGSSIRAFYSFNTFYFPLLTRQRLSTDDLGIVNLKTELM